MLDCAAYLVHRVISPKQRNKVSKVYNINLKQYVERATSLCSCSRAL